LVAGAQAELEEGNEAVTEAYHEKLGHLMRETARADHSVAKKLYSSIASRTFRSELLSIGASHEKGSSTEPTALHIVGMLYWKDIISYESAREVCDKVTEMSASNMSHDDVNSIFAKSFASAIGSASDRPPAQLGPFPTVYRAKIYDAFTHDLQANMETRKDIAMEVERKVRALVALRMLDVEARLAQLERRDRDRRRDTPENTPAPEESKICLEVLKGNTCTNAACRRAHRGSTLQKVIAACRSENLVRTVDQMRSTPGPNN
jgi:hypothetical protein